ncbi:MAG: 50S ribosomal protein L22 [Magnetococcales bacterium]|nr:50S ribosomal protein L22 [Magnetococcales bacterium]
MEATARLTNLRISPSKARLVIDLIRGLKVDQAVRALEFSHKRIARDILGVLRSAMGNAENNFGLDVDQLIVSRATVDQGTMLKRIRPRARGRANRILKRSSHVTIGVSAQDGN